MKPSRTLALRRESLTVLTDDDLYRVVGGMATDRSCDMLTCFPCVTDLPTFQGHCVD